MRLSVVMAAYNAAQTIGPAIESVARQTRPADQIVLVDDGSTDDTAQVARRVGVPSLLVVTQPNQGAAHARNVGVDAADGDVVAFLDADDIWRPSALEQHARVLSGNPEVLTSVTGWTWGGAPTERTQPRLALRPDELHTPLRASPQDLLRYAFGMTMSTVAVRRHVLQQHRFDPSLRTAEDRDLWIRLVAAGPVWFEPRALTRVGWRDDSLSRSDVEADCRCMLAVLNRYADWMPAKVVEEQRRRVLTRWAGGLLAAGRPRAAWAPARARLSADRWSPSAWWIVAKCGWLRISSPEQP